MYGTSYVTIFASKRTIIKVSGDFYTILVQIICYLVIYTNLINQVN